MYKNQGSMAVRCSSSGRAIGAAIQHQGSMAVCWANPWGMTGLTGWEELGFYRADSRTKPHYPAKKKDRTRSGRDC